MLVLIAIVITLVPAIAILWPFLAGINRDEFEADESAPQADLMQPPIMPGWPSVSPGRIGLPEGHGAKNIYYGAPYTCNRDAFPELRQSFGTLLRSVGSRRRWHT